MKATFKNTLDEFSCEPPSSSSSIDRIEVTTTNDERSMHFAPFSAPRGRFEQYSIVSSESDPSEFSSSTIFPNSNSFEKYSRAKFENGRWLSSNWEMFTVDQYGFNTDRTLGNGFKWLLAEHSDRFDRLTRRNQCHCRTITRTMQTRRGNDHWSIGYVDRIDSGLQSTEIGGTNGFPFHSIVQDLCKRFEEALQIEQKAIQKATSQQRRSLTTAESTSKVNNDDRSLHLTFLFRTIWTIWIWSRNGIIMVWNVFNSKLNWSTLISKLLFTSWVD